MLSSALKLEMYYRMKRIRGFEEAANQLWDDGKVPGYCHSSIGQEAAVVGACMALRDDDYITGTHRSHAHPIGKGADLNALMAELLGKESGICKGRGGSMHLADTKVGVVGESAIVGGGIPLATGAGLTAHVKGTDQVSLAFFGDGAVNQGSFHESINMASIWNLPVIYFCENNLYAISTPLEMSHGQSSIALRAEGYGIPGITVDGQDVTAVYNATYNAVLRARQGGGATLIEAKTYRFDEHNTGLYLDLPYRNDEVVERYKKTQDPLTLFKVHLLETGISLDQIKQLDLKVSQELSAALAFAEDAEHPLYGDVDRYMFSDPIEDRKQTCHNKQSPPKNGPTTVTEKVSGTYS